MGTQFGRENGGRSHANRIGRRRGGFVGHARPTAGRMAILVRPIGESARLRFGGEKLRLRHADLTRLVGIACRGEISFRWTRPSELART